VVEKEYRHRAWALASACGGQNIYVYLHIYNVTVASTLLSENLISESH